MRLWGTLYTQHSEKTKYLLTKGWHSLSQCQEQRPHSCDWSSGICKFTALSTHYLLCSHSLLVLSLRRTVVFLCSSCAAGHREPWDLFQVDYWREEGGTGAVTALSWGWGVLGSGHVSTMGRIRRTTVQCLTCEVFYVLKTKLLDTWKHFGSVQSLSPVQLFETPWTAARQASLFVTNSRSMLKLISMESAMPWKHLDNW